MPPDCANRGYCCLTTCLNHPNNKDAAPLLLLSLTQPEDICVLYILTPSSEQRWCFWSFIVCDAAGSVRYLGVTVTFEPRFDRYGLLDLIQVWVVLMFQLPSGFTLEKKCQEREEKSCETPQSDLSVWM